MTLQVSIGSSNTRSGLDVVTTPRGPDTPCVCPTDLVTKAGNLYSVEACPTRQ